MNHLPITHITLYKHGVGYFQRAQDQVDAQEVTLTFRVEEINDILKSLTVIDRGEGRVLSVDYATPRTRHEQLAGCSVQLDNRHSLRDLIISLRGRDVRLHLDDTRTLEGKLIGLDEANSERPMSESLVTILQESDQYVATFPLARVDGVTLQDDQAATDLSFFLRTSLNQEDFRPITIRLTPGLHDLQVSYIAPAPTWRVSYRLLTEAENKATIIGWGIFDNWLEEELKDISLSLVAGMPISFTYDLYTPFTPKRPHVQEEERTAAAPVAFDMAMKGTLSGDMHDVAEPMMAEMAPQPKSSRRAARGANLRSAHAADVSSSIKSSTSTKSMGELFQYTIDTPVSVGRGQSAMVPIVSTELGFHKELIYNGRKLPKHPVATIRMPNDTGLTLERGPVTVIDNGEYVGEAVLPFTGEKGELIVPYAVELGASVSENQQRKVEQYRLRIENGYLLQEEWEILIHDYQINNRSARDLVILIEHPRDENYDLTDTPEPAETTEAHLRFKTPAPAQKESRFRVKTRRLLWKRESLQKLTLRNIQLYLRNGLADAGTQERLREIESFLQPIEKHQDRAKEIESERNKIYEAQKQIRNNLNVLTGKAEEAVLRNRYVNDLTAQEDALQLLTQEEANIKASIAKLRQDLTEHIKKW